jgi:FKBP-type peptidyl-prolyl cis-trans isomerase 2
VRDGDTVKCVYSSFLPDGGKHMDEGVAEEMEFVVGSGQVIAGFDKGVRGAIVGEPVELSLPPALAFGEIDQASVVEIPLSNLPANLSVGAKLRVSADGQVGTVKDISDEVATVDLNHILAGKTVHFTLTVIEHLIGSGPQLTELSPGDGMTFPRQGDVVTIHYTGTVDASGKEFDSSRKSGKPFEFELGGSSAIEAWERCIVQMSVGQVVEFRVDQQSKTVFQPPFPPPGTGELLYQIELLGVTRDSSNIGA